MTIQRQIRNRFSASAGKTAGALAGVLFLCNGLFAVDNPSEYQVKAAYLLNFTKFIEWPSAAFETPDSPLAICILGDDPFGSGLDQLVEGETVKGRKLSVERLQRAPAPKACQVLFISNSKKDTSEILTSLSPGVLTVSDRGGFLKEGGMIAFVIEDRHVRFDINQRAAVRASLTMNARMLNVARFVQK